MARCRRRSEAPQAKGIDKRNTEEMDKGITNTGMCLSFLRSRYCILSYFENSIHNDVDETIAIQNQISCWANDRVAIPSKRLRCTRRPHSSHRNRKRQDTEPTSVAEIAKHPRKSNRRVGGKHHRMPLLQRCSVSTQQVDQGPSGKCEISQLDRILPRKGSGHHCGIEKKSSTIYSKTMAASLFGKNEDGGQTLPIRDRCSSRYPSRIVITKRKRNKGQEYKHTIAALVHSKNKMVENENAYNKTQRQCPRVSRTRAARADS